VQIDGLTDHIIYSRSHKCVQYHASQRNYMRKKIHTHIYIYIYIYIEREREREREREGHVNVPASS